MINPVLTAINYNALTGILTIQGNNLTSGLLQGNLILTAGNQSLTLNTTDSLSNVSSSGFTVTLSDNDQALINAFLNSNGNNPFTLSTTAGWDGSGSTASQQSITVAQVGPNLSGLTTTGVLLDISTINPFSTVNVTDSNSNASETATISFTAANGTLSGSGLSTGSVSNGIISYTLTASSASALQQALQGLVFTPTAHQVAAGQLVNTTMTLTINDSAPLLTPTITLVGSNGISSPDSVATDNQGHVWVANRGTFNGTNYNSTIEEFSASGVLMQTFSSGFSYPYSVATDSQGNVWIANQGVWNGSSYNSNLQEFSASGALLHTVSSGVSYPYSLATDSQGNVWLANLGPRSNNVYSSSIQEFSASGVLLHTMTSGVSEPRDIATDSQGNVWVANNGNNTVQEFSASGVLLHTLTSGLSGSRSLATDSQGNVWVANSGNNTLEQFSASGALLHTLSNGLAFPYNVITDKFGDVWVVNNNNSRVEEFSASGVLLNSLSRNTTGAASLSADSQGNVWVANFSNNTVEKLTGTVITHSISNQSTSLTVLDTVAPPTLTSVSYDASSGKLAFNGSHLISAVVLADLKLTAGSSSFTLNAKTDTVSNVTSSSFTISLNTSDQAKVNGLYKANGTSLNGNHYNLSASAGWDGSSSIASQPNVTVLNAGPALSGLITQSKLLDTATVKPFASIKITNTNTGSETASLTFTAKNGALSGAGLTTGTVNNGIITDTLTASSATALQQALASLTFTPTAHQAAAGQTITTAFNLKVADSYTSITNSSTQVTVTETAIPPALTAVSYNASSGSLTFTGSNLTASLVLGDLTLKAGSQSFTLNASTDTLSNVTANGFIISLNASDKAAVNAFFNSNGSSSGSNTYSLSATIGWDGVGSAASQQGVTVSQAGPVLNGFNTHGTLLDTGSINPFSTLTVTDSNSSSETASISFTAANGSLSGAGLTTGTVSNGLMTDTLTASSASALQQALQALVFTPSAHQTTAGQTITTAFNMTVNDGSVSVTNSNTQVTVTETAIPPVLSAVSYNASTGTLSFTGNNITSALVLGDLTLTTGNQTFTLNANTDMFSNVSANGFTVSLSATDKVAVNAFFNSNGTSNGNTAYSLSANVGWDGNGSAASQQTVTVSQAGPVLNGFNTHGTLLDTGTINLFSTLTVTDSNSSSETASISFTAANGNLSGAGLTTGTVTNGLITDTLTASSASALQQALQALVFTPTAHQTTAGQTITTAFNMTVNDGSVSVTNSNTQVTVTETAIPPVLSAVSYNASTGSLTFTGSNLTAALVLSDLTLTAGNQTFTLNASNDSLSNVSANGFTVSLSASDQAAVNAFFNSNGTSSGNTAYSLSATAGWDGANSSASQQAVTVSQAGPILSGLTTQGSLLDTGAINPFSTVNLTDSNTNASETASITFTAANGTLSGTGLTVGTVSNGMITDTLTASSASALQQELQGLVFTPTAHQAATGQTVSTAFTLSVTDQVTSGYQAPLVISQGISNPNSLVIDSLGNVWVSNLATANSIGTYDRSDLEEFSASGHLLQTITTGTLSGPSNFKIDSQGNIWVTNTGNIWDSSWDFSSNIEEFSANGTLLHHLSNGYYSPNNINIDSQGNVWVTNSGRWYGSGFDGNYNSSLEEFSANGSLLNSLTTGLSGPNNLTFDSQGNVWVTNLGDSIGAGYNNSSLEEFSASGTLLHNLTGLNQPSNVTFDSQGNVWVTNLGSNNGGGWNSSLEEFSANGTLLHNLTGLNQPQQLKIDSQGNIWVTNLGTYNSNNSYNSSSSLEEFSANGTLLHNLTGLTGPNNLTFDSQGNVWVTNQGTYNGSLEEFSVNGTLMNTLTTRLSNPKNLKIDSQGNIWVTNGNNTIEKFSPTPSATNTLTNHSTQISVTETAPPSLTAVSYNASNGTVNFTGAHLTTGLVLGDLTLTAGNQSFTLNANTDSLSNVTANGFTVTLSASDQATVNAFFSSNGNSNNSTTYNVTTGTGWDGIGSAASQQAVTVTNAGPILTGLTTQGGLLDTATINPFNSVTIADSNPNAIEVATISFTAANGVLSGAGLTTGAVTNGIITDTLSAGSASALQQALQALVFTPTAHQVAAGQTVTTGMTLTVSDLANTPHVSMTLSQGIATPQNILVDKQNNIWVANSSNNTVEEFSASGVLLNTLSNGIAYPRSLAMDSQGHLWVANGNNNTVEEFSVSGTLLNTLTTGIATPAALSFDSQGNLWVDNRDNNTVEEFAINGTLLNTLTTGISFPRSLVTDHFGHVWVANLNNNTVEEFSTSGALLNTLSAGISQPRFITTDNQGNLWVDNWNGSVNTVEKFSASGVLLTTITTTGSAVSAGLGTDAQGNIWIANSSSHNVLEYSASGVLLNTITTGIANIFSLTVDNQGNIWIGDTGNNTVDKISLTSNTTSNQSTQITVTDTAAPALTGVSYNASIGVVTFTGSSLTSALVLGDLALTAGNQSFTLNASTDSLSNVSSNGFSVALSSSDQAAVNAFFNGNGSSSANNAYSLSATAGWDGTGSNTNQQVVTVNHAGASLSGMSSLSLLDTGTVNPFSSLTVSDTNTTASEVASISYTAANGVLSGTGLILGTTTINNGIITDTISASSAAGLQQLLQGLVFTPTAHQVAAGQSVSTAFTLSVTDTVSPSLVVSSGVSYPLSLATDSQGNVWVDNFGTYNGTNYNSSVEEFSASGVLLNTLVNNIADAVSIATDGQGNVWVGNANVSSWNGSNYSSSVQEYSASGVLLQTLSSGVSYPYSEVIDSHGNVWVANEGTKSGNTWNSTLEEFSASGTLLHTLNTGLLAVATANSLAIDSAGDIWFANRGIWSGNSFNSTVQEYSASGVLLQTLSSANGLSGARSIATDHQGHIWVANLGTANGLNSTLEEFSTSGVLLNTVTTGLSYPFSISTDNQGNVWVANQGTKNGTIYNNTSVEEFSTSGTLLHTFISGVNDATSVATDSQGNVWVSNFNNSTVEKFNPSTVVSNTVSDSSTKVTVIDTAKQTTVSPNNAITNPTVIQSVHTGDTLTIADALQFNVNAVTTANVTAAGGSVTNLAGWVNGALSVAGADEASHSIDWFNFNGNTYLLEQAHGQGSAYGSGDTLVQLVGVFNESQAGFSGHTLTLV